MEDPSTSLRLSKTSLGDEAGGLLTALGEQCKSGTLRKLGYRPDQVKWL